MGKGRGKGQMGDDEDEAEPVKADVRVDWIVARATAALSAKAPANVKIKGGVESMGATLAFLDDDATLMLLCFKNEKGEVTASNKVPDDAARGSSKKFKSIAFLKVEKVKISVKPEEMVQQVLVQEFTGDEGNGRRKPLDYFSVVSDNVFQPLLADAARSGGWPEVLSKEVTTNMNKFLAEITVICGETAGRTLLPLPQDDDGASTDKERFHTLETAIITWTRQIKAVLKADPEAELKAGNHVGPEVEIAFWKNKAANLNSISDQLGSAKIQKVIEVLETVKSTYLPAFLRLCQEVMDAREEANSNMLFLAPLEPHLDKMAMMDSSEFKNLGERFGAILHLLMLIWKHSKFYNSATRLVVLVREICNLLIHKADEALEAATLLEDEPTEARDKLKTALDVCGKLKTVYFSYKTRIAVECPDNPWRFQNSALFARLDSFLERCHDLLELTETVVQFNKLEKIEVGGTKGKTLTNSVGQIYEDFVSAKKRFDELPYEILNVEAKQFDDDFYEFRVQIKELERRLGSVVTQGFDDCTTVYGCFKLLDSFDSLLERELIMQDLEKKHVQLVHDFGSDLKMAMELFAQYKDGRHDMNMIGNNAPPVAGRVAWLRGIMERIEEPYRKFQTLNASKSILDSEEAKEVFKTHELVKAQLQEYETTKKSAWDASVGNVSDAKLKLPLLRRELKNDLPLLTVNFDQELVKLLREVKYLLLLNMEVPESAAKIYEKAEVFRQQTGNLDLIVNIYNGILTTVLDVEKPLIDQRLQKIDKELEKGLKHLTWKSHGINEFVTTVMAMVKETDVILRTIKQNVVQIREILSAFETNIMLDRKEQKTYTIEEFEGVHEGMTAQRANEMSEGSDKVEKLMVSSNKALKISKGAAAWKNYVDWVSTIVLEGICTAILASTDYLKNQLDNSYLLKHDISPLLEIKLELVGPNIQYNPSMGEAGSQDELRDTVYGWVTGFCDMSKQVTRLDIGEGDYLYEIEEDLGVGMAAAEISDMISEQTTECRDFSDTYRAFEYLWTKDMQAEFDAFLLTGPVIEGTEEDEDGPKKEQPTLEQFQEAIEKYKAIGHEVQQLPNSKVLSWLKIDCKPIKQAIATWVSKWKYKYTQYVLEQVEQTISTMVEFMQNSTGALNMEVEEGNRDQLLQVLEQLEGVKSRQMSGADDMFDPLKARVTLLSKFDITTPPEVVQMLEEAPQQWTDTKKLAVLTRERIAPLQNSEAARVKMQSEEFALEVEAIRQEFLTQNNGGPPTGPGAPYKYTTDYMAAYVKLQGYVESLDVTNEKGLVINEMQRLFELVVTEFRSIKNSLKECTLLKIVWDHIALVHITFTKWRETMWDAIDTETLIGDGKKLAKILKGLDKQTKMWDCFKVLDEAVKNMLSALPLMSDLHSEAMRDRHWKQLMRATGKQFTMSADLNLGTMLDLKLHEFAEDVGEIVDRATKEVQIEKQLVKIESNWQNNPKTELVFMPYDVDNPEGTQILILTEDLVEGLEEDQVLLQNLAASKYVLGNESFNATVQEWNQKLGQVDGIVRTLWLEVQKKWSGLEPIFIGSADIRVQLPEDSKRFDGIDEGFKELMKEAVDQLNAVAAASVGDRETMLTEMLAGLELCEKSLNDYLDTKRLAFPRFYFVAGADLLDILSKGSSPHLIQEHFPKNFDSIQKLTFLKDEKDEWTKTATNMISPQGEITNFHEPLECDGAVEIWLARLLKHMQQALRVELDKCIKDYDEFSRQDWIFRCNAQMTIVVSRLVYTEDINRCFDQIEEGNENAFKDYLDKVKENLKTLSDLINGKLDKNARKKIITLVTTDVHGRDVIGRLIKDGVEEVICFQWQSQLRYHMDEKTNDCIISVCDWNDAYGYEYIGNPGCLVITPLTDRCYITLTQASRLVLGGAPAGPAGTGKTETTKDLARALGLMCYVFNCGDQMNYIYMASIYSGLAQAGCWGCFDEFNRITIEVLSVCSTQYKMVLDGIRAAGGQRETTFMFGEDELPIITTVMAFITMNPGYAGRTELPESLKVLFRPVSMVVPDMIMICENMLFAEGFVSCEILAQKFMMLYNLSADLLSKADHYDWKLRAVKTTLNVAGSMKREQSAIEDAANTPVKERMSEAMVLLRALRDFNVGKLSRDDITIFMGLLDDLFPNSLDKVPRAQDLKFEQQIKDTCKDPNTPSGRKGYSLQSDDMFVLKVTQLREILTVRWSVFVLGVAGSAKTELWRTTLDSANAYGEKATHNVLNPKAVTRDELYGFVSMGTGEWNDGLISQIFRDFSREDKYEHEWIILDGDIDAEWIESMNTVMDDNKLLTLASGERIPLTDPMRLIFEIGDLRNASPATVSRAGVIFINEDDIGWGPFVSTWIEKREDQKEQQILSKLFEKYVPMCIRKVRQSLRTATPVMDINMVSTLAYILEGVMGLGQDKSTLTEMQIEGFFVFGCIWAFGGAMHVDKVTNNKELFDKWWREEWKTIKFPEDGRVYDYVYDPKAGEAGVMVSFTIDSYVHDATKPIGNMFVATNETSAIDFVTGMLIKNMHPVMFVGAAGTGKTALMANHLGRLDTDAWLTVALSMNSFTDSMTLQSIMSEPLEKKSGINFGPPGSKKMVYFIDDFNMPLVDTYGTQEPIELVRTYQDYKLWYEREKLTKQTVTGGMMVTCMNPTAGNFVISSRMQRHFATFCFTMPLKGALTTIYHGILSNHMSAFDCQPIVDPLVNAGVELNMLVAGNFLPSAVKFHYMFNLRDISTVFGGLLRSNTSFHNDAGTMIKLWIHENSRVYRDRLVNNADLTKFDGFMDSVVKKHFAQEEAFEEAVAADPLLFTTFSSGNVEEGGPFMPVKSWEKLKETLESQLKEHNDTNAAMNLVLFKDAMEHITRICRIIAQPQGNAMLVGVGGSGKQSLARLSAFICQYETYQITVTSSYGVPEFLEDLKIMYTKAGVKGNGVLFLLTDQQIVNEKFCVYLNDMLSSGKVAGLFARDEIDNMCNAVRGEVKQAGLVDTNDVCYEFFIEKVRKYLHCGLCFSPVGDTFRIRARQFPALVNNTMIDWFHPWSQEALMEVANRFLQDMEMMDDTLKESMANHMAFVHTMVTDASERYLETERRFYYTTPKSFLELIALYKSMLGEKLTDLSTMKERLESGLEKLQATADMVAELKIALETDMAVVEEKKAATDALLVVVGQKQAGAEGQKAEAAEGEAGASLIKAECDAIAADCAKELEAAEPIIQAAMAALNSLTKAALGELKGFGSPADAVVAVTACTICLTAGGGKATKVPKDKSWAAAKKMMGNVDQFMKMLQTFDKDNVNETLVAYCEKEWTMNDNPSFPAEWEGEPGALPYSVETIGKKSTAAGGLCDWTINICKYFRIYQVVKPKRDAGDAAQAKLDQANLDLTDIRAQLKEVNAMLDELDQQFMTATEEKQAAIDQAEATQKRAGFADRLVNGLADEGVRWGQNIEKFGIQEKTLIGDAILASAFVSYAGAFTSNFRVEMITKWTADMVEREIPMTENCDHVETLASVATIAGWKNEGLPADPVSIENGAIMTACARWPLMVDPQLQGITWINSRESANSMKVIQLSTPKYIDMIELAIQNGDPVMIENLGQSIDAVLDPVIQRSTIKKGRNIVMKLGDKEVDYDPKFRLYLQTKLANPHYVPEVCAQTTIVNFTVTESGLEDQLLAIVVVKERPDLQQQADDLIKQMNDFAVQLSALEDNLLMRLANAEGDILADIELIENLEETKVTSTEIAKKVEEGKITAVTIDKAREVYRPVAERGALLYFLVNNLNVLSNMYQFAMSNYVTILKKGMDLTEPNEDLAIRIAGMTDISCFTVFKFVAAGLYERHKLTFAANLCFRVLQKRGEIPGDKFMFLLRAPRQVGAEKPEVLDFLSLENWETLSSLEMQLEDFANLCSDLEGSAKRWKEWAENPRCETEPLPGDWKKMTGFDFLLVIRCIRPDRMNEALAAYVRAELHDKYTRSYAFNLPTSFEDSAPDIPCFFFLSPGMDVMGDVEALAKLVGYADPIATVSLGQGQEPVAEKAISLAHKAGGWVVLQNIHLTPGWTASKGLKDLVGLENILDKIAVGAHPDFRLFLTAEPSAAMPISVLQASIKLTNEPPEGIKANLARAIALFTDDQLEECSKAAEFKNITFALCFFHSILLERKKFGTIGFSFVYPFNNGDLINSQMVCMNYLEANSKVPWDDLRYNFGEIMYGGHVFNDWDRRLTNQYLEVYMQEALLDTTDFFPKFGSPPAMSIKGYLEFIEESFPAESPEAYGLHPNAEIGFRLNQARQLFLDIEELQPRTGGGGATMSVEDTAKQVLDDILDKLNESAQPVDILELGDKLDGEERTPYMSVFLQEIERFNILVGIVRSTLSDLNLGLKGDLTVSDAMEALMNCLYLDRTPPFWEKKAYPSLRPLSLWVADLLQRAAQLHDWAGDPTANDSRPKVTWIAGFFNPQSFLTAVQQVTARRNEWALDKTVVQTEVTKKRDPDEIDGPSRDGSYVNGMTLEGARWDDKSGQLDDSQPKELFHPMPVILIKAVTSDKAELRDNYACPVYKTRNRPKGQLGAPDGGFVFTAGLKTKQGEGKWIMAGVAMLLDEA